MDFDIVVQRGGESVREQDGNESVWVLLSRRRSSWAGGERPSNAPRCSTTPRRSCTARPGDALHLEATSMRVEWAVVRAPSENQFESRVFAPADVASERRGAGLAQDACLRNVRLIFDRDHPPRVESRDGRGRELPRPLVELPAHHHDQPEIYHYRFTAPQGYGHAELGETCSRSAAATRS